jgi:anaerobic dimethyl sulfoxide reductase subunit B (iron-sulfur subunit)
MMPKQLAFYVDISSCVGCKACQIACKDKHGLPVGVLWRRVIEYGGGDWVPKGDILIPENVFSYFVSISCNHCEKPACLEACPVEAIYKREEDGLVLVDKDVCTGCWECKTACPYGAPQSDNVMGYMTKCTFCEDLLAKDENPVCVDACPMRAIQMGELAALTSRFGNINDVEPLPGGDITKPALVLNPHRHSRKNGTGGGRILNLEGEI